MHCAPGRSTCLFGFLSQDHALCLRKGTARADVVNYKVGLFREACVCVCGCMCLFAAYFELAHVNVSARPFCELHHPLSSPFPELQALSYSQI